ncbi:hypothetical protein ACMFMG_009512 [Clarireedia jacksonii]
MGQALFSGIEVKPGNGGNDEALIQLAVWFAAGLQNLRRFGELDERPPEDLYPTVGWTVIGHDWYTYIVYTTQGNEKDVVNVIGPWRVANTDTRDVVGVFKVLRLLKRAIAFAEDKYWPWLRDEVLMPCTD